MPATSQRQYRAMQAAAHGHSTLGIPSKVGREFVQATPSPGALPARKDTMAKKNWIAGAVKRPGQLHRDLGIAQGKKIPAKKLEAAAHSRNPKVRQRAQFAKNMHEIHIHLHG